MTRGKCLRVHATSPPPPQGCMYRIYTCSRTQSPLAILCQVQTRWTVISRWFDCQNIPPREWWRIGIWDVRSVLITGASCFSEGLEEAGKYCVMLSNVFDRFYVGGNVEMVVINVSHWTDSTAAFPHSTGYYVWITLHISKVIVQTVEGKMF